MPFVAVPDKNSGDVFTTAMWTQYLEGNLNAGVERPIFDSGILVASASAIDMTALPQTFAGLRLECYLRGDTAAASTNVLIRFNNDSGANYVTQSMTAAGATLTGIEALASTVGVAGDCPANTALANALSAGVILIPNYTNAVNRKSWLGESIAPTGTATGTLTRRSSGGRWDGTIGAITRVTLLPGAGNFVAGSRVVLYGLGAM